MAATHVYTASLAWTGSTAVGYRGYSRAHRVVTPPAATDLIVSADPSFKGDPALLNPEQLLLASASSCQLLAFLALAARAGIDVVSYRDDAEARMPATRDRMRITGITLRPRIDVAGEVDLAEVERLTHVAHDECYIANTLACEVVVEPEVRGVTASTPA
ncbi:OsmC family protein [Jatrophihabitans sp. YIM 134969]